MVEYTTGRGTDIYTMGACAGTFEVGRSFVSRFIIEALRASSTYDGTRGRYTAPQTYFIGIIIR